MAIVGFSKAQSVPFPATVELDASQRAVLDLPQQASAAVIGAPGTGKTTTMVELVAHRIGQGWHTDQILVLAPTRVSATRLRDSLSLRVDAPTRGPLSRTATSLAFDVIRQGATLAGTPAPTLLTGGDQDVLLRELIAGHIEDGRGPAWPDPLTPEVRGLRAFRSELRDLMMRATDHGVTPARMAELGRSHGRPEWVAAAEFIAEYLQVVAQSRENQLDPAELMAFASAAIERGEGGTTVDRLRAVLVDDLQEATESTLRLLRALASRGVAIVAFGDPDVAANAFRGGEADSLGTLASRLGVEVTTLHLGTAHRQSRELRALTSAVTAKIGAAAAGKQRDTPFGAETFPDAVSEIRSSTQAREFQAVARTLREHHLLNGLPWNAMAVIVRSGSLIPTVSRALELAEVPTRTDAGKQALRDDVAARSLLTLVDCAIGRRELDAAVGAELLLGPFGGLDRLSLRRLRLALRAEEIAAGGRRTSDDLLIEALSAPGRLTTIDHRVARNADRLAQTLAAIASLASDGGSIEELLWLGWERSGLAKVWHDQALGAGLGSVEANRNLDGIVALFTAAKRFVERRPNDKPRQFLIQVLEEEVPEDTLSARSAGDTVLVTTPSGVVGSEFDIVAVVGLQEGVWPNLRLRGSLLYPQQLVDAAKNLDTANTDQRRQVLSDELRMFALAVSRARRQVVLAAVFNEDESGSMFFNLVPADRTQIDATSIEPLSLRALTGRLRRSLVSHRTTEANRNAAAAGLARLSDEEVPGANPEQWHGLLPPSTEEPLYDLTDENVTVPVSPSKLERFEESPLNWFIDLVAGSESSPALGIGTIVHWVMETAEDAEIEALWAAAESRWGELLFESPWMADQKKRATRALVAGVAEYLGDFRRDGKALVSAEGKFELDVGRAKVRGMIDRIERSADGSIVIVDLKTGSPITERAKIDAHPQLGAYQLAYASGALEGLGDGHTPGGAKLLYVKKGIKGKSYREGAQAPFDEDKLEAFRERVRAAAEGMAASQFKGATEAEDFTPGAQPRYRLHTVRAVSSD